MHSDVSNAISYWMIHSSHLTDWDALKQAYSLGSQDKYLNSDLSLREAFILKAIKE